MTAAATRGLRVTGVAVPNNLPRYLTSFVGRRTELSALKALLSRSRMLTLTGPGGSGKSRLAAELGTASLKLWPEGVWWVELAPLNDPSQMAGAVVSALELPGRGSAQDVVIAWLAAKRALLVLDNCEHLVKACAEFCRAALERCAELTIIVTSREVLGVAGEARWPIGSMAGADAAQLFEARARLVVPDFKVMSTNLEAVTQICERLDGMPLAIELAAARLDMMTEQEILSHLSDRFRLLTGGTRTAPNRQQTMLATIDWSYRLLSDDEALLFRRLAVFRGGFTLESADAVCGEGLAGSVLDLLAGLVQKSMVVADRSNRTASRYQLLESQLAYGEKRLQRDGELELARHRHYEYFRDSVSTKTSGSTGPRVEQPPPGVAEMEWHARESGNLSAAMEWARNHADDLGLGLAVDLSFLWWHSDAAHMRGMLTDLLDRSPDRGLLRVRALRGVSNLAWDQGDLEGAVTAAETSVALARNLRNDEELANSLCRAGIVHASRDEFASAVERHDEATSLLNGSSNRRLLNHLRRGIAFVANRRGDYATARGVLVECLAAAKAEGDTRATTELLADLGDSQWGLKDHQAAVASFKEALFGFRGMRDNLAIVFCLQRLSCVAGDIGDYRRAVQVAAAASRTCAERSYTFEPWLRRRADESLRRSRSTLGTRKSQEAWNQGWTMSVDQAISCALGEIESDVAIDAGPLSRREREVSTLVAASLTNRQIGERLFISERTAEGHIERIKGKLGVRSRIEVATWAVERGLTSGRTAAEPAFNAKRRARNGPPSSQRR